MLYLKIDKDRFVKDLKEVGWKVSGSLDTILELDKTPENSKLRATLRVEHEGKGNYKASGVLEVPNIETILRICYSGSKFKFFDKLLATCGHIEAYFTGQTNIPEIKEVYKRYVMGQG